MSFVKEFREFAVKGNVVDMAVGIIIGAAFGKIVTSFVSDVITPPLGYLIGGVDFTKLAITLPALQEGEDAVTIRYGVFLQTAFDFIIVAFAIFLLIKLINRLKRKEEAAPSAPPPPTREEVLLTEISDLLEAAALADWSQPDRLESAALRPAGQLATVHSSAQSSCHLAVRPESRQLAANQPASEPVGRSRAPRTPGA